MVGLQWLLWTNINKYILEDKTNLSLILCYQEAEPKIWKTGVLRGATKSEFEIWLHLQILGTQAGHKLETYCREQEREKLHLSRTWGQ